MSENMRIPTRSSFSSGNNASSSAVATAARTSTQSFPGGQLSFRRRSEDEKVLSSIQTLHNVSQRLAPSVNTRMNQQGFTWNKLKFSSKLYGRDEEIDILTKALERTARLLDDHHNETEVVMISGYSGTGKTALAWELEGPCRKKYSGCFCSGKYDLQDRGLPYSAISIAFTHLVEEILQTSSRSNEAQGTTDGQKIEADGRLKELQQQLAALLGQEGHHVLKVVMPNLQQLLTAGNDGKMNISEQQEEIATTTTSSSEALIQSEDVTNVAGSAEDKLKLLFLLRKVTEAICKIFFPVVLLLDDLQWVDSASLDLLHALATDRDITGLMILGCYRDNEVGWNHKLSLFLNHLASPAADGRADPVVRLTSVSVGNLDTSTIKSMLEDLLEMKNPSDAERFARVLHTKTFGNIFFVIQFLKTLQQMELLTFNVGQFEWQWDNDEIERKMIATENVAELTTLEIENQLSGPAQNALQIAACLGNEFLESTLVLLITKMGKETEGAEGQHVFTWESGTTDENQVKQLLEQCVQGGFLHRQCAAADEVVSYRFVHDVIQEAAISLIVHQDLAHFHIGKVLIENLPADEQEQNLFVIVDIMNHGMKVHTLNQSRSLLINLNLRAGKKALQSSAFEAATQYLAFSVSLLGCDCWNDCNYNLSLDIFSTAAQAEFCNANLDQCRRYIDKVLAQKQRPIQDKLPVYTCLYSIYNFQEKHAEALSTCLMVFEKLGINFGPPRLLPVATLSSFLKTKRLLRNMDASDMLSLPPLTDKTRIMAMRLMDRALNAAYMLNSSLYFAIIEFKMVRWSIKYGICPPSAVAFAVYGMLLAGAPGELKRARIMGEVADKLSKRQGWMETRSRILMLTNNYIFPWTSHLRTSLKPLLMGYEIGMKEGDLENALFCAYLYGNLATCAGRPLNLVHADMLDFTAQMKVYSQETIYQMSLPHWQFALVMMAESAPEPPLLSGGIMVYDEMMKHLLETNHLYLQDVTRMNQMLLAFYFGDYQLAWDMVEASKDFEKTNMAHVLVSRRVFFVGMTAFCLARSSSPNRIWKRRGIQALMQLRKWLVGGNINCIHMVHLLEAEKQALRYGRDKMGKVLPKFQIALSMASRAGFIHDAALAAERTAEYLSMTTCRSDSLSRVRDYVELAITSYTEWGALAKVDQLKKKWSSCLQSES